MTSTSCSEIAQEVLARSIAGDPPATLPRALAEEPCGRALFSILVEGLADRFEPALCDVYAQLFSQAVAYAVEGVDPDVLVGRYQRVRCVRPVTADPRRVFVLSRVTLGADVAVTSVVLDAAKRRFPHAQIVFIGPAKNYELFAADPRIMHAPTAYRRGGLRDRLASWGELKELVPEPDSLVLDPDSRLTQLGLLSVYKEECYRFFESRAYGAATGRTLAQLTADWCEATLGVSDARPYVALTSTAPPGRYIAVSLGVGENPAKRLPDPFEEKLLALLAERGLPLWIDRGAGGEEAERAICAVERSGVAAQFWDGSFAGFAAIIAGAALYTGYDSAGQHVAAACGVPLISVFAGFPAPRMFERWRPSGEQANVIRVEHPNVDETLERARDMVRNVTLPGGSGY